MSPIPLLSSYYGISISTCHYDFLNHSCTWVQVGSHYHFIEVNPSLLFDRKKAYGMRLNIPAGTATRFEV